MKKGAVIILLVGIMGLVCLSYSHRAMAEVNINVQVAVPPPPHFAVPGPPPVFVIPGTYVYFVPDIGVDIFFYHGSWYRPHQGHWYRSGGYNGPWTHIVPSKVPHALVHLPPHYRQVPPGHERIYYERLHKNWEIWEREKYWDKHGPEPWDDHGGGRKDKHGGKKAK